ncbi:MAG TPA: PQQ-binding-like beta-propeller repeat protein [Terriglobales bacterium]|jgi:outer membrane protein assembly factor BamB
MTKHRFPISLLVGAWITLSLSGCSADWPAFRHNILRTGAQLNSGPLTDPAKVSQPWTTGWTFPASAGVTLNPMPGAFRAGPVVYKGVVYIGNSNGYFYAIDASNGHFKWQYPLSTQPALTQTWLSNPSSEGIASSAFITNIGGKDAVVFGAPDRSIGTGQGSGRLFALDISNGTEIWKSPEIAALRTDGVTHEQIGYSSPLVFNDHVYIGVADHGDDPIQRGKVVAVKLSDGSIDGGFSFFSTGPPRGGGVWGSQAGWIDGIYVTTGNSNIGGTNPTPNHALSMLRLDPNSGNIIWGWQPVPYDLDQDPDWTATPSVMLSSCGVLAVSVQKDGWTWAMNAGTSTPGPASVKWAFPTGPWVSNGFTASDGTVHGDQRYLRPGAAWDDVYIVQTGGLNVTSNVYDGFRHIYALNACAGEPDRIRWIKDIPSSGGGWYSIGPPTVTHGIVYVGTDQGHLVIIGDPSVAVASGWRCSDPDVPSNVCVANGFSLVPDPAVLNDIDLGAGAITTEPALVGDPVYVSTEGGKVIMLKPDP